ncbi:DUF4372 domain-containing protein [Bacillus rhizoplanae]|uniref:DUF4372 domain-containing protein n=1 Tax=Bacillus rhizoplanae TaxID=2880966 RepID=UPI003D1B856D
MNELLNVLNKQTFSKLGNIVDLDKYVKNLKAYKFLQLLILAQINEMDHLEDLTINPLHL